MATSLLRVLLSLGFASIFGCSSSKNANQDKGSQCSDASDELSFISSMNFPVHKVGIYQNAYVRFRVKDLATEKAVRFVLVDSEGKNVISNATYMGPADAGYQVWEASKLLVGEGTAHFHGEYEADSQCYRADDNGKDFELKKGPMFYAGQNIQQVLADKSFYNNGAYFMVAILDPALQKKVTAHYSCDGFLTESTEAMDLPPFILFSSGSISSPTPEGYELWNKNAVPVPATCTTIHYYYSYEVEGKSYMDNNYGHNYVMNRS